MTPYTIALFLHLVGATGLFVALGLEWTSLAGLRRATAVEEARTWLSVASPLRRLVPISMAALLLAGLYLMAAGWGATPWVIAGVLSLLLIGDLGGALTGPRLARMAGPSARRADRSPNASARASATPSCGPRCERVSASSSGRCSS